MAPALNKTLNRRLGAHVAHPYPIELTTEEDPAWEYLRDVILGSVDWQHHQAAWEDALRNHCEH